MRADTATSTNKLIAKLAVDRAKPSRDGNGVTIVEPGQEEAFLRTCTLAEIPLVGPKFQERLAKRGLVTVDDVLRYDLAALERWMSKREAAWLWNRVHGIDDGTVAVLCQHKASQAAEQALAGDYWRGASNGYVFTTGWGEPIYPDTASSLMTKLIRAHNHPKSGPRPKDPLPHARLHCCRALKMPMKTSLTMPI